MKIMSLNIWNYQQAWDRRRDAIEALLAQHEPDVVALQEVRHDFRYESGRGQGEQLARRCGYVDTWGLAQVYVPVLRVDEGLSVLTRKPPLSSNVRRLSLLPDERDDENHRVCLSVTLAARGRRVHIVVTHWSLSPSARRRNAVETFQYLTELSGEDPALVMGDLNAEPDEVSVGFLAGRAEIDGRRGDLVDCWKELRGDEQGFTYASWEPVRRIDYMYARNLLLSGGRISVVGGEPLDGVYPSDHMGLLLDVPAL